MTTLPLLPLPLIFCYAGYTLSRAVTRKFLVLRASRMPLRNVVITPVSGALTTASDHPPSADTVQRGQGTRMFVPRGLGTIDPMPQSSLRGGFD